MFVLPNLLGFLPYQKPKNLALALHRSDIYGYFYYLMVQRILKKDINLLWIIQ